MAKKRTQVNVSQLPAPNQIGKPRVDFDAESIDTLVYQKSYDVIYEKALRCPCSTSMSRSPNPECQNCGGYGWIWINPKESQFLIQSFTNSKSLDKDADIKGDVSVTPRYSEDMILGYMDRITLLDVYGEFSETLESKTKIVNDVSRSVAFPIYKPTEVICAFKFGATNQPLTNIDTSSIVIDDKAKYLELPSDGYYTIRYNHQVQFVVTRFIRDIRKFKEINDVGGDVRKTYPQNVMATRVGNEIDDFPSVGDGLFDNSYE